MIRPRILKMDRLVLATAREIADGFDVSLTAALLKLADSDRFPIILVCHNKPRRRWFHREMMVPRWWRLSGDLDSDSIAFEVLFGGAAVDVADDQADLLAATEGLGRYSDLKRMASFRPARPASHVSWSLMPPDTNAMPD